MTFAGKGRNMDGWFVGNFPISTDVMHMSKPGKSMTFAGKGQNMDG